MKTIKDMEDYEFGLRVRNYMGHDLWDKALKEWEKNVEEKLSNWEKFKRVIFYDKTLNEIASIRDRLLIEEVKRLKGDKK